GGGSECRRTRGDNPGRTRGGITPGGGRVVAVTQLGAADGARQSAWRAVGRARGLYRLRGDRESSTAALPADDRSRFVAGDASGTSSSRVRSAVVRGPGR